MASHVSYSGFVFLDTRQAPTAKDAKAASKMFSKKEIKATRKLHPLFARGFQDTVKLTLTISESGFSLHQVDNGSVLLEAPLHKIFFAYAADKTVVVFVRRSGQTHSYKCHAFLFASAKEADQAAATLTRITNSLGFLRDSMQVVGRSNSIASLDNVIADAPSTPSSALTSPATSDNESDEDTSETGVAPAEAESDPDDDPCGVCRQVDGKSWIALKTCGHQFHLPCISDWRVQHNLCPTCSAPLSTVSWNLKYLGGCFEEVELADSVLAQLASDYKAFSIASELTRVQVKESQLNFLDRLGNENSQISCNSLADLRDVKIVDDFIILLVAAGSGFLITIFEAPVLSEAAMVVGAIRTACNL